MKQTLLILALIWIVGFTAIIVRKLGWTKKQRVRNELIRELRRSGRLRKRLDNLYLKLDRTNKELLSSKDRSVRLMKKFVILQSKGLNAKQLK